MKNTSQLMMCVAAVTIVAATFSLVSRVSADSPALSQDQLAQIQSSCVPAKASLNQLHTSDALLRVNTGQMYEFIGNKLMSNFNDRITYNNFKNQPLSDALSSYDSDLDKFRSSYLQYETQLSRAISINCQKNPADFYQAVMEARDDRTAVYGAVRQVNSRLSDYDTAVQAFEENYKTVAG